MNFYYRIPLVHRLVGLRSFSAARPLKVGKEEVDRSKDVAPHPIVRKSVAYKYLGRVPYLKALQLQEFLVRRRLDNVDAEDILLLLHHRPVYTAGRRIKGTDDSEGNRLRDLGAEYYETKRGGQTTFHGPGQLVGYPIFNLKGLGLGVRSYIQALENFIIATLARFNVVASKHGSETGVWVHDRKIASIGVHVRRHVASHGFALNCDMDLNWFKNIIPCGCPNEVVTSLKRELDFAETMQQYLQEIKLRDAHTAIGDGSNNTSIFKTFQSKQLVDSTNNNNNNNNNTNNTSNTKTNNDKDINNSIKKKNKSASANAEVSMVSIGDSPIDDLPMTSSSSSLSTSETKNILSKTDMLNKNQEIKDSKSENLNKETNNNNNESDISNNNIDVNKKVCDFPTNVFGNEYEYQLFQHPTKHTTKDCSVESVMPDALRAFEQVFGVELKPLREIDDEIDKQIDDFLRKP